MWAVLAVGFLVAQWAYGYAKRRWFANGAVSLVETIPRTEEGAAYPLVYGRTLVRSPLIINTKPSEPPATYDPGIFGGGIIARAGYAIPIQFAICMSNQNVRTLTGPLPRLCSRGVWFDGLRSEWKPLGYYGFHTEPPGVTVRTIEQFIGDRGEFVGDVEFSSGAWDVTVGHHANLYLGTTPVYRGVATAFLCYPVGKDQLPHDNATGFMFGRGDNLPEVAFEIQNGVHIPGADPDIMIIGDGDANPAGVIYDLLTNPFGGRLGLDDSLIDMASFLAVAQTLFDEQNGFSNVYYSPTSIEGVIDDVMKQIDGNLFQDPETLLWTLTLTREDYVVGDLPHYNVGAIVDVSSFETLTWDDVQSVAYVKYLARSVTTSTGDAASYIERSAMAVNAARQAHRGVTEPATLNVPGVSNAELAGKIAKRYLRSVALPLARATVVLSRSAFFLRPGDPFRITHRKLQGRTFVMRVARIDQGEFGSNGIVVHCLQDRWAATGTLTPTPPFTGTFDSVQPVADLIDHSWVGEAPRYLLTKAEEAGLTTNRDVQKGLYLAAQPGTNDFFRPLISLAGTVTSPSGDANSLPFTGTFVVDVAYSRVNDPYDTTVGLQISSLVGFTPESNSELEIRQFGKGLIQVGDEVLAYEIATDQGGGVWLLENVWRGLMDTAAVTHAVGTRGFVVDTYAAPLTGVSDVLRCVGSAGLMTDQVVRAWLSPTKDGQSHPVTDLAYTDFTVRRRTNLPYPVVDLNLGTQGLLTSNSTFLGLDETPDKAPNAMVEEPLSLTWLRRDRLLCEQIKRGDDADEAPAETEAYAVLATRDGVEYGVGAGTTTSATAALSLAGHGTLPISVRSYRMETIGGDTLEHTSWQDPTIDVVAHTWRNLLIHGRLDSIASGWDTVSGTPVLTTPGPAFQTGYLTASADPTSIRQRLYVTGYYPARMRAELVFYTKRQSGDTDSTVQVDLKTLNAANVTQDTQTYGPAVGETTTGWTRHELVVSSADVDTDRLEALITMTDPTELDDTPTAACADMRLRLGQFTANLISNGGFETGLTSWTSTAGGFTVETGSPLEGAQHIQGEANVSNERYQEVAVTAGYTHSLAVVQFAARHPGPTPNAEATVTVEARSSGGTVLTTKSCTIPLNSLSDSIWYKGLVWTDVPYNATVVRVRLIATRLSGTNNQVQFDDVDLQLHKYLDPQATTTFTMTPTAQPMPRNIGQWNQEYPTIDFPNYAWLDGTDQPVLGIEPEFEATDGAFMDAKFTGLVSGGQTVTHPAFEVRRGTTGNIRTRSNRKFGNFTMEQAFTVRVVFDCRETGTVADFGLAGRLGTTGWKLEYDSGSIRSTLVGATGTKTVTQATTLPARTWAALVYDPTTDLLYAMSPEGSTSVSTATGMGEISCAELIRLVVGAATDEGDSMTGLIADFQMWSQAMTYADLASLWANGATENGPIDGLSILANGLTSVAATVMGEDTDGVTVGWWRPGPVFGYLNATWGVALGSRTNLAASAKDPNGTTGWTDSGLTSVADDAVGPDGRWNGIDLTGTNAQYRYATVTLAATATVNVTFFARADAAHNAQVKLYSSAGVLKESATITLTTTWQRFQVAFSLWDGATASGHIRFYPSDTGSSQQMHLAGPFYVDQGSVGFGPLIDLAGTGSTSTYEVEALAGTGAFTQQFLDEGEIEIDAIGYQDELGTGNILDIGDGSGNTDRRTITIDGTSAAVFGHYDGAGSNTASETGALSWLDINTLRARWNRAGLLEAATAFAGIRTNGVGDYDRTAIWTPGTAAPDYMLLGGFEGLITRLVVRTREEILSPSGGS